MMTNFTESIIGQQLLSGRVMSGVRVSQIQKNLALEGNL